MGRFKKLLRVGLSACFIACMMGAAALQTEAAKIEFNVQDVSESNLSVTVEDGIAYSKKLEARYGYKLPKVIHIFQADGEPLAETAYQYSSETGILTIQAENVYGTLTVMGMAGELTPVETPTVTGNFVVYQTLTAVENPQGATVTYQWYRDDTAIPDATQATYTLTAEDVGKEVNVQITGIGDYFEQKISTTKTKIAKKAIDKPETGDVKVTHVSKNGGTNGSIVSNTSLELQYYNTVSARWESFPVENKPAGEYQIRFKETADTESSESTVIRILEPCTSPVVTDVTVTSIKVAGESTGALTPNTNRAMEVYNGTSWVSLPISDLKAGKYQIRFAETGEYLASEPTNFFVMEPSTKTVREQDIVITHVTARGAATGIVQVAPSVTSTMEIQVDGVWKTLPVQNLKAGIYSVRYAETETTFPSATGSIFVKEPAEAPTGIQVADVTVHGGNNGSFSGLKTTWQISYDGKTWNDCAQSSLTSLSAGTYYFRTRESEKSLVSESVAYVIRQPEITPEATIDFVNGTLVNLVGNAEYLIENTVYKATETGCISVLEHGLTGKQIELRKKGDGVFTNNSAAQTLTVPARPTTPDSPVVVSKTDTTITVACHSGLEYTIDGETWIPAESEQYMFTGLSANTQYTIHARVRAVEGKSFYSAGAGVTVNTKKSGSAALAPKEISVVDITDTTITIAAVMGQEYRVEGSAWIIPNGSIYTWENLTESTSYRIETRTAETADTMAGASIDRTVKTYLKLVIPEPTVDYWKEAIIHLEPGLYSVNNLAPTVVSEDGTLYVGDYFGRSISLKRYGSDETQTVDSDPITVEIKSPVSAPTVADFNFAVVKSSLNGFVIPSPNVALTFQVLDPSGVPVSEWKSSDGGDIVFEGLTDSSPYLIQVCFEQTETAPKSNAYISSPLYTRFYEDIPKAVVDTVNGQLTNLVPDALYLINSVVHRADDAGKIRVRDHWIGSSIRIVKCGNDTTTVDSKPQELMLPDRVNKKAEVVISPITFYNGSNGKIMNLTSEMEYSADNGETWVAIQGNKLENLPAGDYLIRYKGIAEQKFPSESTPVKISVDEEIAAYKESIIAQLQQAYDDMADSKRYTEAQLTQIQGILNDGVQNMQIAFSTKTDVDNAKETVLQNMALVPCHNTPTADGNMVGEGITKNDLLEYPEENDEIWGNVTNDEGLDSRLQFVIEKLGHADTELLRAKLDEALSNDAISSFRNTLSAEALKDALKHIELALGLDITLAHEEQAFKEFKGTYTVTILLPVELKNRNDLNVIAVNENGDLVYHTATKIGSYLTFETDHFSIYGLIGSDELAIALEQVLEKIADLQEELDLSQYSKDNRKVIEDMFAAAIADVHAADSKEEIDGIWAALLTDLQQIPMRRSLGWLWVLITLLIVLIALSVACYLVWHVRYYDGDELLHRDFHFWRTKVVLWTCEQDDRVLEGWYHDTDLTDRAENEFMMPWHGVKLYAKWNTIEILPNQEDSEKEAVTEELPAETDDTLMLLSEPEVSTEEESVADEDIHVVDESNLLEAAPLEEVPEEVAEEAEPAEEPEQTDEQSLADETAEDENQNEESVEEVSEEEHIEELQEDNSAEEVLEESAEEEITTDHDAEKPAVIVVGDPIEEEEETFNDIDDSYKNTESYRAWLQFADEETDEVNENSEKTEDGDEVQLFVNEKTGEKYHIRFNVSFRAKLTSLSDEAKGFYRELKDEFLTYKGVKSRISWKAEAVRKGRETIARFAVRENTLCIFLALDPDAYADSKYVFESVKDIKAYEAVPMLIRVKSDLSCRKVKELITEIMQTREVKRLPATPETDYAYLDEDSSTEARLRAGQLRIWAEGPDDTVCTNRAAAATLHYLISPEITAEEAETLIDEKMLDALMPVSGNILIVADEVGEVSLEQICKKFYVGDTVDIDALKEKGLLDQEMMYVKITSSNEMTKRLTISAHIFERTAAKMILLTGGDVNIIAD